MSKSLNCADIIPGCPEVVHAETEAEVLKTAAAHAASAHGIAEIDASTLAKIRAAIREA